MSVEPPALGATTAPRTGTRPAPASARPAPEADRPATARPTPAGTRPTPAGARPAPAGDDVDRVIEAWNRQRPDLDLAPLSVLSRVSRLARRLDRARDVAFARHELAVWEFDVLVALRRTGPPYRLTPGQLLAETLVTSGTMTNRIDRLEARGLVVREPVADDRRGTWVALTDEGRSRVDGAFIDLLAEERDLLAVLPPEDQSDLAASLRRLLLQFESPPD